MDALFKDLDYSIRTLLRRPGFTAVVVLTLALGIGANTAIFSVVNAVLLRPLTYRDPERLVSLWENVPVYGQWRVTPANFFDWKQQNTAFEGLAAFGASTLILTGIGEPEQLQGTRASEEVVGVEPLALVLLIACANIAGLILAQHAARSKEIAIRAALGAGRWQLMRQFFMEGFLLSLTGAAAGVALAVIGVQTLTRFIPQEVPRLDQVQMDLPVLGFTSLLALLTCVAFGFLPAWQASKPDLQETMEQGQRSSGSHARRHGLRRLLVVLQVTMAVMLVIGSGLLIKTFWRLRQVDPGFKPERGVIAERVVAPRDTRRLTRSIASSTSS